MDQRKIVPWIYGTLVVFAAFVLGYFAGTGAARPQVTVTVSEALQTPAPIVSEVPVEQQSAVVNLNTADQQELQTLPGIGAVLAERILQYRSQIGCFVSKEQLMDVEGIGQTRYDNLEHLITVEVTP